MKLLKELKHAFNSYWNWFNGRFTGFVFEKERHGIQCHWSGSKYGTPKKAVNEALQNGKNVILEIELNGARQVRKNTKTAILIFVEPPSWEELTNRLINRGTESEQSTQARLDRAKEELSASSEFDYVVINHQVEQSVAELVSLALR